MNEPRSGLYTGLSNEAYHADTSAVSKTMLDLVHKSPPLLKWYQRAPVDDQADKAVDLGNAFEAALLEPERYDEEYITAPEVDRRTNAGKAQYQEFLDEAEGKNVLSYDLARQIRLMVESAWAHPLVEWVLRASVITQGSYYWSDPVTDIQCKCRPDVLCTEVPLVVDLKVSADERTMRQSMANHRWAVQAAMYSSGLTEYYGGEVPNFVFLCVHSSRSAGRYEVHMLEFKEESKNAGDIEYRSDLEKYSEFLASGNLADTEKIQLPAWALAQAEGL